MSVTFSVSNGAEDEYVNMANTNAADVLRALGYEECCGEVHDLAKFISMCDAIIAAAAAYPELDPSRATRELVGESGCRVIFCGRKAGYIAERVSQIKVLALKAQASGGVLMWG